MFVEEKDIRFRIFRLLVDSESMMTLSEIASKLRIPQQNVSYHLPFLERGGLIIREGTKYFCQPLFLDEEINGFCANRMSDIVEMFSKKGNAIFSDVEDEDERGEVIMNCLLALVLLQIYPGGKN
jgi:DNA-binding transcriptional ArsR family regulator